MTNTTPEEQLPARFTVSADSLAKLHVDINCGFDHFVEEPAVLNEVIDAMVRDSSVASVLHLYYAADTAFLLDRPKDALFLFHAAQLRLEFDGRRYGFGAPDGNNAETYLSYLNFCAGQDINPLMRSHPKLFWEAIKMVMRWNRVIPSDEVYYQAEEFGDPKLPKAKWKSAARNAKVLHVLGMCFMGVMMLMMGKREGGFRQRAVMRLFFWILRFWD